MQRITITLYVCYIVMMILKKSIAWKSWTTDPSLAKVILRVRSRRALKKSSFEVFINLGIARDEDFWSVAIVMMPLPRCQFVVWGFWKSELVDERMRRRWWVGLLWVWRWEEGDGSEWAESCREDGHSCLSFSSSFLVFWDEEMKFSKSVWIGFWI